VTCPAAPSPTSSTRRSRSSAGASSSASRTPRAFVGNIVGSSTSAPGTPTEFLTKLGAYSANVSTLGSGTAMPYTVDVRLTIEGTNFGDTADETFTAEDVRCRISFSESADGYSISVTGKVYGSVIAVNSANTVTFAQIS
jgi:hypothetical protein